jgi:hypothetical protein
MWTLCYLEPLLSENKYCPQASLSLFALVDRINQPLPDFLSLIMPSVASYFTPIIYFTSSSIFDILLFPAGRTFIRRLFAN